MCKILHWALGLGGNFNPGRPVHCPMASTLYDSHMLWRDNSGIILTYSGLQRRFKLRVLVGATSNKWINLPLKICYISCCWPVKTLIKPLKIKWGINSQTKNKYRQLFKDNRKRFFFLLIPLIYYYRFTSNPVLKEWFWPGASFVIKWSAEGNILIIGFR